MRTGITSDASLAGRPLNRGVEARSPALHSRHGVLRAYGVSPAYRELHRDQRQMDRNGAQHRKSSPWRSRGIGKAGKGGWLFNKNLKWQCLNVRSPLVQARHAKCDESGRPWPRTGAGRCGAMRRRLPQGKLARRGSPTTPKPL
eukprot:s3091_g9.t1